MKLLLRVPIVVAAMIAGGWTAGELADRFYLPGAGPGEWGMAAAQFTIVVLIPAGALAAGTIALILTRRRNRSTVR